ncbi:MAG: hypothetical protein AAF415_13235 [Pseudomonadota bacterium]
MLLLTGQAVAQDAQRILFIGNSFTKNGGLAQMTQSLAASIGQPRVFDVEDVSFGGATLSKHIARGDALAAIEAGGWDVVVLQDFSDVALNGQKRRASARAAGELATAARAAGAELVFFAPWAPGSTPERRRDTVTMQIERHYAGLARRYGGRLARVGRAWRRALALLDTTALRLEDDHHANLNGTYLAALVVHAAIMGEAVLPRWAPEGLDDGDANRFRAIADALQAEGENTAKR